MSALLGLFHNKGKELARVMNKELIIDEKLNVWFPKKFCNEDKSDFFSHKGKYDELLVYIDSLSCSSCQIKHLYKWQQVAEQIEKSLSVSVVPIILMSPRNADTLALKYEYYNGMPMAPVIIENEYFRIKNPWIESLRGKSVLLLNQERRIIKKYR